MSKKFVRGFDKARSKGLLKYGRNKLGRIIRIITGHNALNYFRHKIDSEICEECRYCMEGEEKFWPLIAECPVFGNMKGGGC